MTAVEGGALASFNYIPKQSAEDGTPRKWFYDSGIGSVALSSYREPVSYLPDIAQYK
jgi:hypothetical protein